MHNIIIMSSSKPEVIGLYQGMPSVLVGNITVNDNATQELYRCNVCDCVRPINVADCPDCGSSK
jgi:hypothetical protein